METPEKIPLGEAVARGLIPCSVCGATGASVQQVEGKKHFLCYACSARARRWRWIAAGAAALAALALVGGFFWRPGPPPGDEAADRLRAFLAEVSLLIDQKRLAEARDRLAPELARAPDVVELNRLMGFCLDGLSYHKEAIAVWQRVEKGYPEGAAEARFFIGRGFVRLGHAPVALPYLETPLQNARLEEGRRLTLGECYLDLERYDDARRLLEGRPPDPEVARLLFRALTYADREEEAGKLVAGLEAGASKEARMRAAQLRAIRLREQGDFEGALRVLDSALAVAGSESNEGRQLRRSSLAVHLESGDLARLDLEAEALARIPLPQLQAEALWYRALGKLAAGKREDAVELAREFLRRADRQLSQLRQNVLMMQHLAGERKDEDLEKEAASMARFWANDLYGYLALATRDRKRIEKALESTPGRNFPYYCVRRLLER